MTDEEEKHESDRGAAEGRDDSEEVQDSPAAEPEKHAAPEAKKASSVPWKRWAFAVVPAVGLIELGLHVSQTHGAPTDADWSRVRDALKAQARPDDLVVVAPDWVDPLAREKLGEEILTIEREARPDDTRFPRAIEVSMRGKHAADLASWHVAEKKDVGPFEVTTYENPAPAKLKDDLVKHMASGQMHVFRLDGGFPAACPRQRTSSQTGNIGFGPGIPGDRFNCPSGGFVGITVLPDLDYVPHQCFFAPPQGGNSAIRIVFDSVHFGRALHGHHAISVHAERDLTGAPVTLVFRAGEKVLGRYTHRDGDGWKGFEADTSDLDGTIDELTVEISASNANNRQYCFEADTR